MSVGTRAVRGILSVYRSWSATRPPRCRYFPSCSAYAQEAVEGHGAMRGGWLALRRVSRCRPGGGFGYDPVPGAAPEDLRHDHEEVTHVG